jgi:C-terminal processing protease CtpA/Prc
MRVDTSLRTAFLEVNTFASGNKLRKFFRQSFRRIHKDDIQNIVVDMRSNGGGSVILSNLLTKYIAAIPFKIADSLYALKKKTSYREYQGNYFLNRLFFIFLTHKKKDGYYHFTHFENRYFKPKQKNHFDGTTYVLTGGNTFSAATLFTKALIYQPNVVVVGEETGGGAYGNTAWLIPDVTLPNTKVRFRLPLFRLVIDKNAEKGRGVIPEVEVEPTVNAIRKNRDYKIDKVLEMIKEKKK